MPTTQRKAKHLNWTNLLFFTLLPLIAIVGSCWLCLSSTVASATWLLALGYMFATGLAITAGYHRLFSHKTYAAVWPVRLILLLVAAGAFQGSALEWATDHRNHHRYTDTDKDPYSIKKGFWYAHMGWLFHMDNQHYDFSNVPDLQADHLVQWQHQHYLKLAVTMGFILPTLLALLWGDPLGGLLIAGGLRMTLNHHFTFAINSVAHLVGQSTYSKAQSARDNWFVALFTFGEGFHNFHHQFPLDYRNGIRLFHFDPTKWLIKLLSFFKLTYDLKRVSMHRIIRYRVKLQEQQLVDQLLRVNVTQPKQLETLIQPVLDNIHYALKRMEWLEKATVKIRAQPYQQLCRIKKSYAARLHSYRMQVKATQQLLSAHLLDWQKILRTYHRFDPSA